MKASKFMELQIDLYIKQAKTGAHVLEVCHKMSISEATF